MGPPPSELLRSTAGMRQLRPSRGGGSGQVYRLLGHVVDRWDVVKLSGIRPQFALPNLATLGNPIVGLGTLKITQQFDVAVEEAEVGFVHIRLAELLLVAMPISEDT